MAAAMNDRGTIVAADVRGRRVELLVAHRAPVVGRSHRGHPCRRREPVFPSVTPRSTSCFSTRPVRGLGRSDATLTFAGDVRRPPCADWPQRKWRCSSSAPGSCGAADGLSTPPARASPRKTRMLSAHSCPAILSSRSSRRTHSCGIRDSAALLDPNGFLRTLPFRHGLEAFFAARLVKTGRCAVNY